MPVENVEAEPDDEPYFDDPAARGEFDPCGDTRLLDPSEAHRLGAILQAGLLGATIVAGWQQSKTLNQCPVPASVTALPPPATGALKPAAAANRTHHPICCGRG
jgi:hypothetical protein